MIYATFWAADQNGLGSSNSVSCDYLLTENKSNFCNQGLLMCCGHRPQYFNSQYPLKLFQAALIAVYSSRIILYS